MKTHVTVQLLDQQSSRNFMTKFLNYIKSCALNFIQIQRHKHQLFQRLDSINITSIFSFIDSQKKNALFKKNMKKFLIQQNIQIKELSLNLYYTKYAKQGMIYLDYEDLLTALLPTKQKSKSYLSHNCQKRSYFDPQKKILINMASLIIGNQINFMGQKLQELNELINNSLQKSAQLWRLLDFEHKNHVSYQNIQRLSKQYNIQISETQWSAFLRWHFKAYNRLEIKRQNYMRMFDKLLEDKKICSEFNLEQFRDRNKMRSKMIEDEKRKIQQECLIRKKLVNIQVQNLGGLKNAENIGKGLEEWAQMIKILKKDHQKYQKQLYQLEKKGIVKISKNFADKKPSKSKVNKNLQQQKRSKSVSAAKTTKNFIIPKNNHHSSKSLVKNMNNNSFSGNSTQNTMNYNISKSLITQNSKKSVLNSFLGYQVPKGLIKSCSLKKQSIQLYVNSKKNRV